MFAVLISLKYLLEQDEMDELVEQIQKQLRVLYSSTKRIQQNQMRKYMGFPENWALIKDRLLTDSGRNFKSY